VLESTAGGVSPKDLSTRHRSTRRDPQSSSSYSEQKRL
jgi:hypothetical protein